MSHTSQRQHFRSLQHAETLMYLQYYGGFCKLNPAKIQLAARCVNCAVLP